MQAYAAGLLEGWITADLINSYWYNVFQTFCVGRSDLCVKLNEYMHSNREWIISQVMLKNGSDAYWYQVGLMYKQLDGLYDGYKLNIKKGMQSLSWENFFWMNIQEDLYDLCDTFNSSHPHKKPFGTGSCSVLIKLLPGHKELYISHVTWNWYETMLRIQKRYRLNYKESKLSNQLVFGHDIQFSSYPGFLYSMDDFYLISSGLAITETTNSVYNPQLWDNVQPIGQILVFIRAMVANRLAPDGLAWTKLFKKYNSGTYNNQWLLINYSLFRPGRKMPKNGLLFIHEEMPGLTETQDVTKQFLSQMYWASYNVPFIPEIFNASGQGDMVKRYGNWFSYRNTPRARIFARDHVNVKDMSSMLFLMRSNDFRNDPEARCESCVPPYSAENAISSRDDLNDLNGVYPFEALGYSNWGAIDAKITSYKMFNEHMFLSVSGPTKGTNGVLGKYCWSRTQVKNISHVGLPDCWDFKPETHHWVF
ncbi:putative phospholipase B-like 2 isoform X2 [Sipha flava]|nr:putative phospholipase B-like 2 isoform X2 [Sipha flava]